MIAMRPARAPFCCCGLGALVTLFWGRNAGEQEPDARAAVGPTKAGHSYLALAGASGPEEEEEDDEEEECDLDDIRGPELIKVGAGRDEGLDGSLLLEELGGLRNAQHSNNSNNSNNSSIARLRVHDYLRFQAWPACLDLRTLAPALVSLEITHCPLGGAIHDLDMTLPPRLRRLVLSYDGLTDFEVRLPRTLRDVDLSFNKLRRVPTCLEEIRDLVRPSAPGCPGRRAGQGPTCRLNLANNDFWYDQGTDVPLSLINQESILELTRAHDWGLLAGVRLKRAMDYLDELSGLVKGASSYRGRQLGRAVAEVASAATTYDDGQNVHMPSVQRTVRDAVQRVMRVATRGGYDGGYYVSGLIHSMRLKKKAARKFRRDCADPSVHRELEISYGSLCESLHRFVRAEGNGNAAEIFQRMGEEYTRTKDTCFTGRITHLLSALNGLVPGFAVGINGREELGNSLARVRNKWAALAGTDFDKYIAGAVPEAMQVLEDACVPEGEQASWLMAI